MGTGKKDLEIVYNLQWRNATGNGDDKANIVGMYDIPATTINWETFKSYLLKNSGATCDDVRVSYVSSDDLDFPIESQMDFQIALYSFRKRARNGEIITLKLDRISDNSKTSRMKRLRRSAEQRLEEEKAHPIIEPNHPLAVQDDGPPEWFKKYMKGYKKEIVEEVTSSVISNMSNVKLQNSVYPPCHHSRKSKVEPTKRPRKLILHTGETNDKDLVKSLKLERKLDSKLEKLEQKTMKIKEKKMVLLSSDSVSRSSIRTRPIGMPLITSEFFMDASAEQHEPLIPHMSGGETYQQEWEVVNTGAKPWTSDTELRYAWGSEALKAVEKSVACPKLNPGEKGAVVVYLEIPRKPGYYECYWHFHHEGRRFGHWLGCHIMVDPFPAKLPTPPLTMLDNTQNDAISESLVNSSWTSTPKKLKTDELDLDALDALCTDEFNNFKFSLITKADDKPLNTSTVKDVVDDEAIQNMTTDLQALQVEEAVVISDANSSSDSDNQSIVSIADSTSSLNSAPSDEFVVVAMPQCLTTDEETANKNNVESENLCIPISSKIKVEKIGCAESNVPPEESDNNNNNQEIFIISENPNESAKIQEEPLVTSEIMIEPGYAYVIVSGQKIAVPKRLLRSDYLETAEEAPTPKMENNEAVALVRTVNDKQKGIDSVQNCKVTQSIYASAECIPKSSQCTVVEDDAVSNKSNKSRLFVFPLNCPGFEVVYPSNTMNESLPPELSESFESNRTSMAVDGSTISQHSLGHTCDCPSVCKTENRIDPMSYSWSTSNTAYTYPPEASAHINSPPLCSNLEFDQNAPPPQNENGTRARFHHRFGNYIRHKMPFNHSKQYGVHYQPSFHTNAHWPPFHPSSPPCCSPEGSNRCTQTFGFAGASSTNSATSIKLQSPVHANVHEEVPNNPPGMVNGNRAATVHILPDTLVSGAVNVASSAINTARSVLNMFTPPAPPPPLNRPPEFQAKWENGHWTTTDSELPRERALRILSEMGFWDRDLNATLLARYNDDLARVISELVQ